MPKLRKVDAAEDSMPVWIVTLCSEEMIVCILIFFRFFYPIISFRKCFTYSEYSFMQKIGFRILHEEISPESAADKLLILLPLFFIFRERIHEVFIFQNRFLGRQRPFHHLCITSGRQ